MKQEIVMLKEIITKSNKEIEHLRKTINILKCKELSLNLNHFKELNKYLYENDLKLSQMEKEDFEMLSFEVLKW